LRTLQPCFLRPRVLEPEPLRHINSLFCPGKKGQKRPKQETHKVPSHKINQMIRSMLRRRGAIVPFSEAYDECVFAAMFSTDLIDGSSSSMDAHVRGMIKHEHGSLVIDEEPRNSCQSSTSSSPRNDSAARVPSAADTVMVVEKIEQSDQDTLYTSKDNFDHCVREEDELNARIHWTLNSFDTTVRPGLQASIPSEKSSCSRRCELESDHSTSIQRIDDEDNNCQSLRSGGATFHWRVAHGHGSGDTSIFDEASHSNPSSAPSRVSLPHAPPKSPSTAGQHQSRSFPASFSPKRLTAPRLGVTLESGILKRRACVNKSPRKLLLRRWPA
jgi:hypothetical protein